MATFSIFFIIHFIFSYVYSTEFVYNVLHILHIYSLHMHTHCVFCIHFKSQNIFCRGTLELMRLQELMRCSLILSVVIFSRFPES